MNITDSQVQLTLDLDTGLTERFRSVREVMAAGIYRRGLKRMAGDLDVAPGNLSVMLSGEGQRHLEWMCWSATSRRRGTGRRSITWWRYCGDPSSARDEAIDRLQAMLGDMTQALAAAGLSGRKRK